MPFADHDDVAQAFTSNRPDHPLGIRVLPRRAGRNDGLLDVQHPGAQVWMPRWSIKNPVPSISNRPRIGSA